MSCVPFTPDYSCCEEWSSLDEHLRERATDLAWSTLRALTGGQVGNCPVVVIPCLTTPCDPCSAWWGDHWNHGWVHAQLRDGQWSNCICPGPKCGCKELCEIVMPGPVAAIVDVAVGSCALSLDHFHVENGNRIVRTDGRCWPECVDLRITYLPGILPDSSALWAAGVLACEFAKACSPGSGGKCRLPQGVQTISRQGVSMTFEPTAFPGGLTGIREVDAYLVSVNPHGLKVPPMVWSPDVSWAHHRYLTPTAKMTP